MSPEKQRIAIAKCEGWKWLDYPDTKEATKGFTLQGKWVIPPFGGLIFPHAAPDYLNEPGAMLKAVLGLNEEERESFARHVFRLSGDRPCGKFWVGEFSFITAVQHWPRAYLMAKGKWEEAAS